MCYPKEKQLTNPLGDNSLNLGFARDQIRTCSTKPRYKRKAIRSSGQKQSFCSLFRLTRQSAVEIQNFNCFKVSRRELVMNPGKYQSGKQRGQDLG